MGSESPVSILCCTRSVHGKISVLATKASLHSRRMSITICLCCKLLSRIRPERIHNILCCLVKMVQLREKGLALQRSTTFRSKIAPNGFMTSSPSSMEKLAFPTIIQLTCTTVPPMLTVRYAMMLFEAPVSATTKNLLDKIETGSRHSRVSPEHPFFKSALMASSGPSSVSTSSSST